MTGDNTTQEIVALLREMRDRQQEMAETTWRLETLLKTQIENASSRVEQSIELQKLAVDRQRQALLLGVPLVWNAPRHPPHPSIPCEGQEAPRV